jgi:hypothetical protein
VIKQELKVLKRNECHKGVYEPESNYEDERLKPKREKTPAFVRGFISVL